MNRYRRRRERAPQPIGWYAMFFFAVIFAGAIYEQHQGEVPAPPLGPPDRSVEMKTIVEKLLPLFTLPSGEPLKVVIVAQTPNDKWCATQHNPAITDYSAYTWLGQITVCNHTLSYPVERLERVIRHELVHAWIQEGGVKDDADHGTQFMKKALEVGAYPLDEF